MPKVSVIVPIYGVEKYIERCARSLFEQTLDDIEYLFIDDCTPDKSVYVLKKVLDEFPHRKEQVIIHRMEQNSGQAAVRKWGMLNATGEYIIHCDSDDWVDVSMYEKMYQKGIEEFADIVVCNCFLISDANVIDYKAFSSLEKYDFLSDILSQKALPSLWNKLIKKELCKSYDLIFPQENMGEDVVLVSQMVWNANTITFLNESLYYYYINPQSITRVDSDERIRDRFRQATANAHIVKTFFDEHGYSQKIKFALVKFIFDQNYLLYPLCRKYNKDLIVWRSSVNDIIPMVYKCPFLSILNKTLFYSLVIKSVFCLNK